MNQSSLLEYSLPQLCARAALPVLGALAGWLCLAPEIAAAQSLMRGPSMNTMPTMRMPGGGGDGGIRMPTGPRFPGGGLREPGYGGGGIVVTTPPGGWQPIPRRRVIVIDPGGAYIPPPPPPPPIRRAANPPGGGPPAGRAGFVPPPSGERRFVPNEVILDIDARVPDQTLTVIARQNRLTRLESHEFVLTGRKLFRWRINDNRSVAAVIRSLQNGDRRIAGAFPNYLYQLTQAAPQAAAPLRPTALTPPEGNPAPAIGEGDPAQYTLAKLRVPEAHRVATGDRVLVAVIDSGIDTNHPDLAGVVSDVYDLIGGAADPHPHGTGMAGAIASRGRLIGVAPRVQILAIRAFGVSAGAAQGTTFNILKSLDWAHARGARIVNMSFAGPTDAALRGALATARGKGMVLVAAAGNAGPKSPPLYPASDANVIAVTATDADDKVFAKANRGPHIAVAAPGVDVLVPAPEASYQLSSGTSVAAAHVSGIAALLLERNQALDANGVRNLLTTTAKSLGPRERAEAGAGLADAYRAIVAASAGKGASTAPLGTRQ